ncbi:holo-[acyl-carrier-protein] synthase [Paenibacillus sp. 7124]|uniref:Holo-[acyl-carrier-protein] synthase n=1 Tax=Paenibacillus apii TaxID=1850370 RepID=A0A6M1PQ70_9BACL|nr:holo-ACP synthase [Paenibacillus apii]NGM84255.1 holo-[acyl-carrier-protein] synthase [Paenibacillus apii]NJJ38203.1 holo-[acyl-carrier-protein] synthase [Paenibacillus apii]
MIYGIGHDVLEIERIAVLLKGRLGGRFARRILTGGELCLAGSRGGLTAEFAAGRFAAKEAVAKALGSGIGAAVGFADIEILPGESGRPEAVLSEEAWTRLNLPGGYPYAIHLTITHTRGLASAFAVVEQRAKD